MNSHWSNQLRVAADKDPIFNHGLVLGRPVVVTGNGARSDIDVFTHLGVTQIAEM